MRPELKQVTVYSDLMVIVPHTTSLLSFIGKSTTVREFAGNRAVTVCYAVESTNWVVVRSDGEFMEGPLSCN